MRDRAPATSRAGQQDRPSIPRPRLDPHDPPSSSLEMQIQPRRSHQHPINTGKLWKIRNSAFTSLFSCRVPYSEESDENGLNSWPRSGLAAVGLHIGLHTCTRYHHGYVDFMILKLFFDGPLHVSVFKRASECRSSRTQCSPVRPSLSDAYHTLQVDV